MFKKMQGSGRTYYYPTYEPHHRLNLADLLHVDTEDGEGYGGALFKFDLEDGTVDEVRGPFHTNSGAFFTNTGKQIGELHLTRITLWLGDDQIYHEQDYVLGHFYRGDRIAHQLANAWNATIKYHVETAGGSHTGHARPESIPHPLSVRKED